MPRSLRVIWLALVVFFVGASAAHAADSLTLSYGADPTEEVLTPVTATWSAAEPGVRLIVTGKVAVSRCGRTYAIDDPFSTDVINRVVGSTGSSSQLWRLSDAGTLTLCGYLQRVDTGAPLAVAGPVPLTYRSARASVAIQVAPRVSPGQLFPVVLSVSAELRRQLEVTLKPAGVRGCGASYLLDAPVSVDVFDLDLQGNQRYAPMIRAPSVDGVYLLCAYVGEGPADPAPEATAMATFDVGPDLCAEARTGLVAADRAVDAARSSVTKYRNAYRRDRRRMRSSQGAARVRYHRLAHHDRRGFQRALRRRAAARRAAESAQTRVTAECAGA